MNYEDFKKDFKGFTIPNNVLRDKDLTLREKVFVGLIMEASENGKCTLSNREIADFFKLSIGRTSYVVNSLKNKGYIKVSFNRDGKQILNRIIEVTL